MTAFGNRTCGISEATEQLQSLPGFYPAVNPVDVSPPEVSLGPAMLECSTGTLETGQV